MGQSLDAVQNQDRNNALIATVGRGGNQCSSLHPMEPNRDCLSMREFPDLPEKMGSRILFPEFKGTGFMVVSN